MKDKKTAAAGESSTMSDKKTAAAGVSSITQPVIRSCAKKNFVEHFDGSIKVVNLDNLKFNTFEDFVHAVEQGVLHLDQYNLQEYARIQIRSVTTNKRVVVKDNEPQIEKNSFCTVTKALQISANITKALADGLMKRYESNMDKKNEGSGWSFSSLDTVEIYLYKKQRSIKKIQRT